MSDDFEDIIKDLKKECESETITTKRQALSFVTDRILESTDHNAGDD